MGFTTDFGCISMPTFHRPHFTSSATSWAFLAVLAFGLATEAAAQTAASGRLEVFVRDSRTGFAVGAPVALANVRGGTSTRVSTDATGRSQYELSAGYHELEIAEGSHKALKTHFQVEPQSFLSATMWVEPKDIPNELRDEVVTSKLRKGYALIHGHVVNMISGGPLARTRIYLEHSAVETQSDSKGYFLLYALAPVINDAEEVPPRDTLVAEAPGYKTYRLGTILLAEGDTHYIVDMEAGAGTIQQDRGHKMTRSGEELATSQRERPNMFSATPSFFPHSQENSLSVTVPASIRVGFSCSCRVCSTVSVYPLEEYVRLGLDDEWIASWRADSLRAGAVAYRSYGVYHVYHPINPNYDICSTTCCQVNRPETSANSTDRATAETAGIIVVDNTQTNPFFAEYAAENNDHNCPDGETGDGAGWPCMSDAVDLGTTFNGHGRGMCQWGTQRWALNQQKDWVWITDHYYNNNGSPSGMRSGVIQWSGYPYEILYSFPSSWSSGANPSARLSQDSGGTIYGTTDTDTPGYGGLVFRMNEAGSFSVLRRFDTTHCTGYHPDTAILIASNGNLYGTNKTGGQWNYGTVYDLNQPYDCDPPGPLPLHSFQGWPLDGDMALGDLIEGSEGSFYGTTYVGGTEARGTIYSVDAFGGYTFLYSFTDADHQLYGPYYAGLVQGSDGKFYGTASGGGSDDCNLGCGGIYRIDAGGAFEAFHPFAFVEGSHSQGPLILARDGNFYGTAKEGGSDAAECGGYGYGCGTLFKISQDGTFTLLHAFIRSEGKGYGPVGNLTEGPDGSFYGVTIQGGDPSCPVSGCGTVFRMSPEGDVTLVHMFHGIDGYSPRAGLMLGRDGRLYGTTYYGGLGGAGVVFRITLP